MPLGHSGYYIPVAWLIWLAFFGLVMIAALYVQVLHWESQFEANRALWLVKCQAFARQLRTLRLWLNRRPAFDVTHLIAPAFQGLGRLLFWGLRIFLAVKFARP